MNNLIKRWWPDAAAIVAFLLLSLVYFAKPVSEGLVLSGHDHTAGIGSGQEIAQHMERTGEVTRWTNSLFGGMPTYQIAPSYGSRDALDVLRSIYELGLSGALMYVFILLAGFYILLRAWGCRPLTSGLGAVLWAFSSYFFIIIGAGHIWKVLTLAFIPPTIAGMVLCFQRGRLLLGGAVAALFMAFQILSNHLQMTYYFALVMLLMWVAYLVQAVQAKQMARFWKATGTMAAAVVIACAANLSNLYHTYEYSKESMRGAATLTQKSEATDGEAASTKGGLTKEYITQWSYGIDETWTLLVPNAKGGASTIRMAEAGSALDKADPQSAAIVQQLGQYWGEQPFTAGPVYVGAFVLMLFILGLFVVKGPMKWALLAATVISVMLSWGHNFMGLTGWCIDNVPMYNKFRTVSSILVIAEFTIPLLAVLALKQLLESPEAVKRNLRWVYVSLALTGGAALLMAVAPSLFFDSFVSGQERQMLTGYFAQTPGFLPQLFASMTAVRQAILSSDAWRSFWIVAIGFGLLMAYMKGWLKAVPTVALVAALCLVDMYAVNKRYLNDRHFVEPRNSEASFAPTQADQIILQDKDLDYRVLNINGDAFNSNDVSYHHKSVGGYHPAKLGRYADLIAECLQPEMRATTDYLATNFEPSAAQLDSLCPVINMLNTKYLLINLRDGQYPLPNPAAMGNAWMVHNVVWADGADQEMAALKQADLHTTAVADVQFKDVLAPNGVALQRVEADTLSRVTLTAYEANHLEYTVESPAGGVAVFSEIFYPGWTATLDGQPLELGRANYVLRAAYVPAGKHQVTMEFKPASVRVTEGVAYTSIALLVLSFLGAIGWGFVKKRKEDK